MDSLMRKLELTKAFIEKITHGRKIEVGLVLGSGLGDLADKIKDPIFIDYKTIYLQPHYANPLLRLACSGPQQT